MDSHFYCINGSKYNWFKLKLLIVFLQKYLISLTSREQKERFSQSGGFLPSYWNNHYFLCSDGASEASKPGETGSVASLVENK